MPRRVMTILLLFGLAPVIWLREQPPPEDAGQIVAAEALPMPPNRAVGPFRLTGAWHLTSSNSSFLGFSTLAVPAAGRLTAFSDTGIRLDMPQPGQPGPVRIAPLMPRRGALKAYRDVEAAALDPATGEFWLALEGRNLFMRTVRGKPLPETIAGPELAGWATNSGAETMVRLADGRFMILAEGSGLDHAARLLPHAPDGTDRALRFSFTAPVDYLPTDAAQLPDGRVLILLRELRWPMPPRFGTRIMLADPATIRAGGKWSGQVIASLDGTGLEENYEGLAIEPGADGQVIAWLISDNNGAVTQRTLLLRLELRLSDLPPRQMQARTQTKQKAPG